MLDNLIDADIRPKGHKIHCKDEIEAAFNSINKIFSSETILNYQDYIIPFTVNTDASDKHLSVVIGKNNSTISILLTILIKPRFNYTMIKK